MNRILASLLAAAVLVPAHAFAAGRAEEKTEQTDDKTKDDKAKDDARGKADVTDAKTESAGAKVEDPSALQAMKPAAAKTDAKTDDKAAATEKAATPVPGAAASAAAPAVDRVDAAKLAIYKRLIEENVPTLMAAEGKYITVSPAAQDFGGSAKNPITGMGPVVVSVRQIYMTKSAVSQAMSEASWGELREYAAKLGMSDKIPASGGVTPAKTAGLGARIVNQAFSKYGNRTFTVDVDSNGNGAGQNGEVIIDSVRSNNFMSGLSKVIGNLKTVLTPQFFKDVVKATQPKQIGVAIASVTGVGGSIATANPVAMIAATAAAAVAIQSVTSDIVKDVQTAVAARNAAQQKAVSGAAAWAKATLSTNDPATSSEAYREYQSQLASALPGTRPMSFEQFVGQLQLQRL